MSDQHCIVIEDPRIWEVAKDMDVRCTKKAFEDCEDGIGIACSIKRSLESEPELVLVPIELYEALVGALDLCPTAIDPTSIQEEDHCLEEKHLMWLASFMKFELGICIEEIMKELGDENTQ